MKTTPAAHRSRSSPSRLASALIAFVGACAEPQVDVSDLSTDCGVDADCVVMIELPCTSCQACAGVPLAATEQSTFEMRLAAADLQCLPTPEGLCAPCAEDDVFRLPRCVDGQCTAAAGSVD